MAPSLTKCLALLALLAACDEAPERCPGLTVFAAQSLEPALSELALPSERISFAASGHLLRQLELGAPAGLFLAAGEREATAAASLPAAASAPIPFAANRLVLAVPPGNPASIASLADLPRARRVAVGRAPLVPAGRYAREVLESEGLLGRVKLVEAESAPQAVAWLRTGEAEAGLVYESDAAGLQVIAPVPTATPIVYPAVILRGSCEAEARSFLDRLRSPEGSAVLMRHGLRQGARLQTPRSVAR